VYLVAYKVKTQQGISCYGLEIGLTFTIQITKHVEVFQEKEG
jgi:hypothetical protein